MKTFKDFLAETRQLKNIRLTDHQQYVMSLLLFRDKDSNESSPNGTDVSEISKSSNLATARDILMDLKLIEYHSENENKVIVTDAGYSVADDEGLYSDGSITQRAIEIATKDSEHPTSSDV